MPLRTLLASSWTLVILAICWVPDSYLREAKRLPKPLFRLNVDKLVHMGIFAAFMFLWMRVGTSKGRAWKLGLAGVALAILSELGQASPIVHRDASLADTLADVVGLAVGLAAHALARKFAPETPA